MNRFLLGPNLVDLRHAEDRPRVPDPHEELGTDPHFGFKPGFTPLSSQRSPRGLRGRLRPLQRTRAIRARHRQGLPLLKKRAASARLFLGVAIGARTPVRLVRSTSQLEWRRTITQNATFQHVFLPALLQTASSYLCISFSTSFRKESREYKSLIRACNEVILRHVASFPVSARRLGRVEPIIRQRHSHVVTQSGSESTAPHTLGIAWFIDRASNSRISAGCCQRGEQRTVPNRSLTQQQRMFLSWCLVLLLLFLVKHLAKNHRRPRFLVPRNVTSFPMQSLNFQA